MSWLALSTLRPVTVSFDTRIEWNGQSYKKVFNFPFLSIRYRIQVPLIKGGMNHDCILYIVLLVFIPADGCFTTQSELFDNM